MKNEEFQRHFEKVAIAQRRLNIVMHGEFIDGERLLNEPDYLETEFKGIVLSLLNHVEIRGKAVGVQRKVEPPKPRTAIETEEQLVSNLLPIKKYPGTIFVSPTTIRNAREAYQKLGRKIKELPFLPKNKKLYAFDDLRSSLSPFQSIISRDEVVEEKVDYNYFKLFRAIIGYFRRRGMLYSEADQEVFW